MKISLKNIKPHTWVSLVMIVIAIVNYALTALGKPIINVGEAQVSYIVNTVLNVIFILYPVWKNQSFTENAQMADKILYMLRDGKITKDELEEFIEEFKSDDVPVDDEESDEESDDDEESADDETDDSVENSGE